MKIIVFDLDETLGYFVQFSIFWQSFNFYTEHILTDKIIFNQETFNKLLDLFPYFLRPDIIKILDFIKIKKNTNCCSKVMIYTNNTGAKKWVNYFVNYFETKINYKLFDQIICAFKVKRNIIELCRTTHNKTMGDLTKCSQLSGDTEICYIDDTYYPEMVHERVYYINIKPYYYDYTFEHMLSKVLKCSEFKDLYAHNFNTNMLQIIKRFNYKVRLKNEEEYKIDKIISKETLNHLIIFLRDSPNQTKKTKCIKNKTRKIHHKR